MQLNYLFVGRCGVGKSTVMNCVIGKHLFMSGVRFGRGSFDSCTESGITYIRADVDVDRRGTACDVIKEVLKQNGLYKIIFVFSMMDGRVSSLDVAVMKLVLDSVPIDDYGLVVQVPYRLFNQFSRNPTGESPPPLDRLLERLVWSRVTQRTNYVELMTSSVHSDFPESLVQFLRVLPGMRIESAEPTAASHHPAPPTHLNYLFVGNPGVGKSTLLNGLAGRRLFKSGVSMYKGLTSCLGKDTAGGITYIDTPGLADPELQQQACAAIEEALKQNGHYKVIFVMTLQAGRLSPLDVLTMKLVLDSAPITKYGILINKVPGPLLKQLAENPNGEAPSPLESLLAGLWSQVTPMTTFVEVLAKDDDLDCMDDVVKALPDYLVHFLRALPGMAIEPQEVGSVDITDFGHLAQDLGRILNDLRRDRDALQATIEEREEEINRLREDFDRMREEMEASQGLHGGILGGVRAMGGRAWRGLTLLVAGIIPPLVATLIRETAVPE